MSLPLQPRRSVAAFVRATAAACLCVGLPAAALGASATNASLIDAVRGGDTKAVTALLQGGADANAAERNGTTALHWAAQQGDLTALKALLQARANVNAKNRYGIAPLWLAVTMGHADAVALLLHAQADPETTRGDSGETVLMEAARAGHVPVLRQLIANGADANASDSIRKQTALMWAAAEKHPDAIRLLVAAGATLDARSSSGLTPLMFAIRGGDIPTTTTLLDLGADLRAQAPDGTTPLALAIINAHWELAARLLDRGADPNGEDVRGRPLHVLAWMRRADNRGLSQWLPRRPTGELDSIDLAKALLARGARINDRVEWKNPNYSPTHMAISTFPGTSYIGATPLYIAAKNCDLDFVKFLVANGADAKLATTQDVTPLLAAAGVGYAIGEAPGTPEEALATVKYLASLGNEVNAVTNFRSEGGRSGWDGAGAMHGAVIRGARGLVEWLIAENVPLDVKSKAGNTALELARGSSLGITYHVQPELAEIIEKAMVAKGIPVSEHKYSGANPIN